MKLFELTPKRREMLANYALNISVISFGVACYEGKWLGVLPAVAGLFVFFLFSREK